jgi:hypothetical protein
VAPSASRPSWGCHFWRLLSARGSIGGGLACSYATVVEVCKVNVLAARSRGAMGSGGLVLACMVLWCSW